MSATEVVGWDKWNELGGPRGLPWVALHVSVVQKSGFATRLFLEMAWRIGCRFVRWREVDGPSSVHGENRMKPRLSRKWMSYGPSRVEIEPSKFASG